MPLEAPVLDNRTFDQIFEEARRQIPRFTPEWTDFNDSDPGITLLQLYAWLTESLFFQMNNIPDHTYIKLLKLFNIELARARPSCAQLTFTAQKNPSKPGEIGVPKGTRVQAEASDGGVPIIFETEAGLDVIVPPLAQLWVYANGVFREVTEANDEEEVTLAPFGHDPKTNNTLYLGFEAEDEDKPIKFPPEMRFHIFLKASQQAGEPQLCQEVLEIPVSPPVDLMWEYRHPVAGKEKSEWRWRPLDLTEDKSAAFTREGYMRVAGPVVKLEPTKEGWANKPMYWLRCRLVGGSYEGDEPIIDMIRPNTIPAVSMSTVKYEILGEADGLSDLEVQLNRSPVDPDSLTLILRSGDSDEEVEWQRQDDLLCSTRDDKHFVLNPNSGTITFGDGKNGLIPSADAQVVAKEYRYGGGARSNAGANQITTPLTGLRGIDSVTNWRPAVGGSDEERIENLKKVAPRKLRTRERAVTAADYEALAERMDQINRAKALPLFHPHHRGIEVPGVVTVVIVPNTEDMPPKPSSDLIRAVCYELDQYRTVGTELYVMGPGYKEIRVRAHVQVARTASKNAVKQNIVKAINDFLSPVDLLQSTSGADQSSEFSSDSSNKRDQKRTPLRTFGQDLVPVSLISEILRSDENVKNVTSFEVFVDGALHDDKKGKEAITLGEAALVWGSPDHEITLSDFEDR